MEGITFLPKSFSESLFCSSSMRYFFSTGHENMYMPMDALLPFGCFGFSSNSTMRPSPSVFIMPKRWASSMGTVRTATVRSAFLLIW